MTRSNSIFDSPLFSESAQADTNSESKLDSHKTQAFLPWTDAVLRAELSKHDSKSDMTPKEVVAFTAGVRCRESKEASKLYSPVEVSLLPWSEEKVRSVLAERDPKSQMTPQEVVSFKAGVICRENPDISKPFAAPGAWFPIDILGNPMRETSPGKWENLAGTSSQLVLRITTAYEQGVGQARRKELNNPYVSGSPEHEAWDLGREHILSQDRNTPVGFGYGGETTVYKKTK